MGRNMEIHTLNEIAGASEMMLAIFAGPCCHYLERLVIFMLLSVKILFLASELQIGNPSQFIVYICKIPSTLLFLLYVSNSLIFFSFPFLFLYCFLVSHLDIIPIHLALMLHLIAMYHYFLDLVVWSIFSETMIIVS